MAPCDAAGRKPTLPIGKQPRTDAPFAVRPGPVPGSSRVLLHLRLESCGGCGVPRAVLPGTSIRGANGNKLPRAVAIAGRGTFMAVLEERPPLSMGCSGQPGGTSLLMWPGSNNASHFSFPPLLLCQQICLLKIHSGLSCGLMPRLLQVAGCSGCFNNSDRIRVQG